ncbi:MAG: hypothetical protein V1668_02670 [Patescibacteria group bacterium]
METIGRVSSHESVPGSLHREEVFISPEDEKLAEKKREFQHYMLARLEQEGVIVRPGEGEIVVDLEKIKNGLGELSRRSFGTLKNKYPEFSGQDGVDIQEVLVNAFSSMRVLSSEDYRSGKEKHPELKNLFYAPESSDAAYSSEAIKKSDFYLGQWEAGGKIHYEKAMSTQDGQTVPSNEAVLAALIYHPKFGDGYRDPSTGKLMVRDKVTREYAPITLDWLQRDMGFGGGNVPGTKKKKIYSPRKYLREEASGIAERGLLLPEDFQETGGTRKADQEFRRQGGIGENGFTMIDGVNYYIGKGDKLNGAKVYKISPDLAGVAIAGQSGDEELKYVFPLKKENELPKLGVSSAPEGKAGFRYTTKEQTRLENYDPIKYATQRADESEEEFARRSQLMSDFNYLLEFSNRLSRETGINLSNFSYAEQTAISYAVKNIGQGQGDVIGFIKEYGEDGLRSLFSAEYGSQYGKNVFEIAQHAEKAEARDLFHNYAELSRVAGRMSEIVNTSEAWRGSRVPDSVKQVSEYQIIEAIVRRAKDMLNVAHEVARKGEALASVYGQQRIECNDIKEVTKAMAIYKEALD